MADTITIAGKHVNKWVVYGGAGALVVGGVLFLRRKKSSSSATDPNAIDPVTGLPYSQDNAIDPLTGQTYLAEAQQYGSVAAAESAVSSAGSLAAGGSSGVCAGSPTSSLHSSGTSSPGSGSFATNAQWAQQAEADLVAIGYNSTDVASAIGRYLAGLSLTTAQANLVQVAIAEDGPPPVNPPAITTDPGTGTPGGSGNGAGTPTPPSHGGPVTVTPVNLHVTHVYGTAAQVAWTTPHIPAGQGPLTGYTVEAFDNSGHRVNGPFTVSPGQLYANIGSLKSKTSYHVNVWCDPAKSGGPHATVSFKTT